MKTMLAFLFVIFAALSAVAQTNTQCIELRRIEVMACTHDDGSGTAIAHGGNEYVTFSYDSKMWPVNRDMLLQKEKDAENSVSHFSRPPAVSTDAPVMPILAGPNPAQFKTKKDCLRAGFRWDKTACE